MKITARLRIMTLVALPAAAAIGCRGGTAPSAETAAGHVLPRHNQRRTVAGDNGPARVERQLHGHHRFGNACLEYEPGIMVESELVTKA
jgi:hypothetical protein